MKSFNIAAALAASFVFGGATAAQAWRAKAQQSVDNAHMRYFIVHLHRLLDPTDDHKH